MITIIHGDDITTSRMYFFEEKKKYPDSVLIDGSTLDATSLSQQLSSSGFFQEASPLFITDFFGKKKAGKELDGLIKLFSESKQTVFFWEAKTLTPKQSGVFPNAEVKLFKLPQVLFAFLDALTPHNQRQLLSLFHQALKTSDADMLFYMLIRHIRILLALSEPSILSSIDGNSRASKGGNLTIEEVARLAPWQKKKLLSQVKAFSKEKLIDIHEKLFRIDEAIKTGKSTTTLTKEIDFFLLSL